MKNGIAGVVLALGAGTMIGAAYAQETGTADAEIVLPTMAEQAPMASRSLLTGIVQAGDRLVAVGSRGHILTSDDGANWVQAQVPVDVLLTSLTFADARNGWAVGHDATILHTQDGGSTWSVQRFQPGASALLDVLFLDAQRGFAIGAYGQFLQTADGGANWTVLESPIVEEGLHFNALTRLNDGTLFLVGEQGMMAASNDGIEWRRLQSPYESSLFAVAAKGAAGAVVGGLRGNVYVSDDAVNGSWTHVDNDSVQSVFGITALEDGSFALAGLNASLSRLDGTRLTPLHLDRAAAGIDGAPPQAPPFVPVESEGSDIEVGAFSKALAWRGGLITVGDVGVRYWKGSPEPGASLARHDVAAH